MGSHALSHPMAALWCPHAALQPRPRRQTTTHRPHTRLNSGTAFQPRLLLQKPLRGPPPPHADDGAEPSPLDALDLNQLHTALNNAIAAENYTLASKIRDLLALALGPEASAAPPADWRRLGVLDWLADRAEDLGYRLPTEVQRRAAPVISDRRDCVVEGVTGSGKTLAFLLPALSLLSYPPDTYPDDLPGPAALVIVPTRELGVQVVMLVYKLFGGSVNPGVPGERANMFRYQGPRGIKVRGLLLADEVESAVADRYLGGAHIVVGTPDLVAQALERGVEVAQHCSVVVVDEVDACCAEFAEQMDLIMAAALGEFSTNTAAAAPITTAVSPSDQQQQQALLPRQRPEVVLVGATLDDALVERAAAKGWLSDPIRVTAGGQRRVPSGLQHRYIVAPTPTAKVGAMCRQILADLRAGSEDAAPARVMVFADSEEQARALSDPLRTVLWGEHAISVLLPGGTEPIKALHAFRDNQTTLLLATPAAARGLDLPAVSHVYNLSPPGDAADYLHRAGRAGRIGSPVAGLITTMVAPEEEAGLLAIGEELSIDMVPEEAPPAPALAAGDDGAEVGDVEAARRALEAALAFSGGPGEGGEGGSGDMSGEWDE